MDNDSFEQSLRKRLSKNSVPSVDTEAALERVLKTANRQVGVGALFILLGRAFYAVVLGLQSGSSHLRPVSRLPKPPHTTNRVD